MRMYKPNELDLSIVLPLWNEEAVISDVIADALANAAALSIRFEIVLVNDGSTDKSAEIVRAFNSPLVRMVSHVVNQGYGAAIRSGMRAARGKFILLSDSDGQFSFSSLGAFWAERHVNRCVIGYRAPRQDHVSRIWLGKAWTSISNHLWGTDVRDINCAFKLIPRTLMLRLDFVSEGPAIDAEIMAMARCLEMQVTELPVPHFCREVGDASGAKMSTIKRALQEIHRLRAYFQHIAPRSAPTSTEQQIRPSVRHSQVERRP